MVNVNAAGVVKVAPSSSGLPLVAYNITVVGGYGPENLCPDSANNVYVIDGVNNRVVKFNNAGVQEAVTSASATSPPLSCPNGCAVDSAGFLYIKHWSKRNQQDER